uniref:Uncharacterized protein n=1 Tax=Oryza punctata TaxID=4537 RepID=A0A0E0L704_ORYPU
MGWWPPATPGTTGFLDASAMAQLFPPRQCGRVLVEDSRGIISHQLNLPSERRWRRNHKLEKCTFFFKEGRERPCRVDICSVAHMDERNTAAIRIESKRLMWLSKRPQRFAASRVVAARAKLFSAKLQERFRFFLPDGVLAHLERAERKNI